MQFEKKQFEVTVPCTLSGRTLEDTQDNLNPDGRKVKLMLSLHVGSGGGRTIHHDSPEVASLSSRDFNVFDEYKASPDYIDAELAKLDEADPLDIVYKRYVGGDYDGSYTGLSKYTEQARGYMRRGTDLLMDGLRSGVLMGVGVTAIVFESLDQESSDAVSAGGVVLTAAGLAGALVSRRRARRLQLEHSQAVYDVNMAAHREGVLQLVQDEVYRVHAERRDDAQTATEASTQ